MKKIIKNKGFIIILSIVFFIAGCGRLSKRSGPIVHTYKPGVKSAHESEFKMPEPSDYQISYDDLLEINVWKHPDLSKEVIVRPDGKISYLLIGDIQAAGLTVAKLDETITKKFEDYAKDLEKKEVESPPVRERYTIGLADELDIAVWKVPDLTEKAIVRPDGKISFPLIGDIEAYGKTLTELDDEITEKLKKYVKDPQVSIMVSDFGEEKRSRITFVTEFISTFLEEKPEVSVIVKGFGSRKVIVLGQVSTPGIYDLEGNARLLDAVGYAGGFTINAVQDNIFVIRGNIYENPTVIKVNAWDIIKRGNFAMNIPLQNQDIVYAPRSIVGNINVLVSQLQPSVTLLNDSVTLKDALKATLKMAD